MNNEQQQIIDEAYKNYLFTSEWFPISGAGGGFIGTKANSDEILTQGLFINKCKTDNEFSERCGLKIEERELSLEERISLFSKNVNGEHLMKYADNDGLDMWNKILNSNNIPTKLITITYNDIKTEIYE